MADGRTVSIPSNSSYAEGDAESLKAKLAKYSMYIRRVRDEEVWLFDCSSGK